MESGSRFARMIMCAKPVHFPLLMSTGKVLWSYGQRKLSTIATSYSNNCSPAFMFREGNMEYLHNIFFSLSYLIPIFISPPPCTGTDFDFSFYCFDFILIMPFPCFHLIYETQRCQRTFSKNILTRQYFAPF